MKILHSTSILLLLLLLQPYTLLGEDARTPPRERIYLATDRDYYVAGEKLFFNLWLIREESRRSPQSRYAYLALRQNGQVVERLTLQVRNGQSAGSLYLQDTLSTGSYEILAYTNWMRNQGEPSFFKSEIFIANRFDRELTAIEPPIATDEEINVRFDPEGGRLLAGQKNRVLVWTGGGVDASHRAFLLLDSEKDTLLSTRMNHHGFASFYIHPEADTAYHLLMDGSPREHPLPPAEEKGLTLLVEESGRDIMIRLHTAPSDPQGGMVSVRHGEETLLQQAFSTDSLGRTSIYLSHEDFAPGLLIVEASQGRGGSKAQRHWYAGPTTQAGIGLRLSESFGKRDKLELAISTPRERGEWQLTVSARQLASVRDYRPTAATSLRNMLLEEEFRMQPCQVEALFGHMNDKEMNEFLIAYPEMHPPEALEANSSGGNGRFMETEGLVVSGRLHRPGDGQALKDVRVLLNTPDTLVNMLYTYTDDQGDFHFLLSDYYRDRELFFSVDPASYEGAHRISLYDKFDIRMPARITAHRDHWRRRAFINKSQDAVSVQIGFETDWTTEALMQFYRTARPPTVYHRPNITVHTDEYLPLDNLREIARELVPVWRIRGSEENPQAILVCGNSGNQIASPPVFFVDGIISHDLNSLMYMGSAEIDKVEVHNFNWVHGDMHFPGIVGLFTKEGEYQQVLGNSPEHARIFHESYRHHRRFSPPEYSSDSRITPDSPDMRQLLFWEPELYLQGGQEEVIHFYTGDISGSFLLTIEGLGPDGAPVYHSRIIEVKP